MTTYDIPALLHVFDRYAAGSSRDAGLLSSFIGEDVLLDVYAHYLSQRGPVQLIKSEVPHRDHTAFGTGAVPSVRDLDAWLVQDGALIACECKQWTASSADTRRSVPADPKALAAFARAQWVELTTPAVWAEWWNGTTKIALPLRAPHGWTADHAVTAKRALIIWRPVSQSGTTCESALQTTTLRNGTDEPLTVSVFSASLYLRQLLAEGTTTLTGTFPRIDALLALLRTIVRDDQNDSQAEDEAA
jgi:hypothetical protein